MYLNRNREKLHLRRGSQVPNSEFLLQNEIQSLQTQLQAERKKNKILEERILQKDKLLGEMAALQNALYDNIDELQARVQSVPMQDDTRMDLVHDDTCDFKFKIMKSPCFEIRNELFDSERNEYEETAPTGRDEQVLHRIKALLKIEDGPDLLKKIQHLNREHLKQRTYKQFLLRIGHRIQELTGKKHKKLKTKQICIWINKLVESHMKLKLSVFNELENLSEIPVSYKYN